MGPQLTGYGIGSGWQRYQPELTARLGQQLIGYDADYLPSSAQIAYLGVVGVQRLQAVAVEQAMPVYLRDKVAKTTAERIALKKEQT